MATAHATEKFLNEDELEVATKIVRPITDAITRASNGMILFDREGVKLFGDEDAERPCDIPAISWWIDDDKAGMDFGAIRVTSDIRGAVVARLRSLAKRFKKTADKLEAAEGGAA